jgi:hypothetical protein
LYVNFFVVQGDPVCLRSMIPPGLRWFSRSSFLGLLADANEKAGKRIDPSDNVTRVDDDRGKRRLLPSPPPWHALSACWPTRTGAVIAGQLRRRSIFPMERLIWLVVETLPPTSYAAWRGRRRRPWPTRTGD